MNKPTPQATVPRTVRPVHEIRMGLIKAAIWGNRAEEGIRHSVSFERRYRDGDEWKSTHSYGRDDLLTLAKIANEAHSWILANTPRALTAPDLKRGTMPSDPKGSPVR